MSILPQKYEVEFLLQQQWYDPRLRYANQSQYEYLNAIHHHEDIWLPDTYFIMHGDFKDPLIPMHFALRIYRNGTINYLMRWVSSDDWTWSKSAKNLLSFFFLLFADDILYCLVKDPWIYFHLMIRFVHLRSRVVSKHAHYQFESLDLMTSDGNVHELIIILEQLSVIRLWIMHCTESKWMKWNYLKMGGSKWKN